MSLAAKVLKGSFVITAGEGVIHACNLVRNVILARLLTKADFGVAAILGMTISMMEIGGRLSIEQWVVQAKEGSQEKSMAVAQFVQAALGLLSAVLILLLGRPLAVFFKVPDAAWALQAIALCPMLRSLSHLDVYRITRQMRFGPSVLIDVVPQIVITIACWPLAYFLRSYAVLFWLLVGKQAASTVAAHFVAERKYRWSFDVQTVGSILSFGWPMLISGLLMFGIMQGDRFAIGIKYSAADLGVYAVAGSLALLPAATLLKLSGSMLLPLLASAGEDAAMFRRRLTHAAELLSLFSAFYALVMILSGGPLVTLIFGAKYHDAGALTAWLGFAQALRLLRGVPTVAAMAKGDTKNLMYSNLWRLSGLALAFPLAFAGGSLESISACAAFGEAVALIGSFGRFSRMHHVPITVYLPACSLAAAFIAVSAVLAWVGVPDLPAWIPLGGTALLAGTLVAAHFALFSESRRLLLTKFAPLLPFRFRPAN